MPKFIDFTGKKIGRVLVESLHSKNPSKWNCVCDCENRFVVDMKAFKKGEKYECKQCVFERKRGPDLTGKKYGRWTVVRMGRDEKNKTVCHTICECGAEGRVAPHNIGTKKSMSCGCWG